MPNEQILHVRAKIRRLSIAEGGREGPLNGTFRPNHNFFAPEANGMVIGSVVLPEGTRLNPGESASAEVTFLCPSEILAQILPSRQWRIQEGKKLLAIGTVIELLPSPPVT
ncbi:MAG: hypothetical protein HYU58_07145 [Proteobacteria bacterium]|nr:hypothetical protein [Pseudomonadota bacterium]